MKWLVIFGSSFFTVCFKVDLHGLCMGCINNMVITNNANIGMHNGNLMKYSQWFA